MAARARNETERGSRTVAKPARARGTTASAAKPRAAAAGRRTPPPRKREQPARAHPERTREIVALVLFALAVFLIFCLSATDKAGAMGRGIETALVFGFGRLSFLVPLAFVVVGVTTVFEVKLRRSYRFVGAMVFLVGLFLLAGGGVPPFGSHGEELFVRAEFEGRAGGLGEVLYAAFHSFSGIVGVGIIGWVLELAGFSLLTGITARWLGRRTRHAAQVVKTTAERSTVLTRRREDALSATANASGPRFGPVDLVDGRDDAAVTLMGQAAGGSAFGDAFDEWTSGRPASRSPLAPLSADHGTGAGSRAILDGAEAFADLYGPGHEGGTIVVSPVPGPDRHPGDASGKALAVPADAEMATQALDEQERAESGQETLPGLAREPRQIELAVDEPSYVLPYPTCCARARRWRRDQAPETGTRRRCSFRHWRSSASRPGSSGW